MLEETKLLLGVGWSAQALTWLRALTRLRGSAATRSEWAPELAVRAGVLFLVVWSLVAPQLAHLALSKPVAIAGLLVCLAGHILASLGRFRLGESWGIGTGYRPERNRVVRRGVYRHVRHPIYLGTGIAIAAQALLLQNLPSLILLAGAAIINPWKVARENRWINRVAVEE